MMSNPMMMKVPPKKVLFILPILVLLTGCLEQKHDLEVYVADVKAKQKPDIEPIPVMKPYQHFNYAAADLRDPFTATVVDLATDEEDVAIADNGIRPEQHRRKEALESYELSELQFVGTLEKDGMWGLIRASDGIINRVQAGNYMGKNHGRVLSVSPTEISLKEIVPSGKGGYVERESTLPIAEIN
jgi:type IV pilus assembly protein PilP